MCSHWVNSAIMNYSLFLILQLNFYLHCVPFNLEFICLVLLYFTSNIIINILVNVIINSRSRLDPTAINSTEKGL